jgi:hypothetical protein
MPPSPFATGLNREIIRLRTANRKLRFHEGSDDVVPKSSSRRSPLISSKPVSG